MTTPYRHRVWPKIRAEVLDRDGYECQIRLAGCLGKANAADHIKPWRDGGAWFDLGNLRAACTHCNSSRSARQKQNDGWRRAKTEIVLVTAGETIRSVNETDVIIDFEALAQAVGSKAAPGEHNDEHVAAANIARSALIRELQRGEINAARVFLTSADPDAATKYPHHRVEHGEYSAIEW